MTSENPAPIPAEQLPITLFDAVVLAVRADDGAIFLSVRDVCDAVDRLLIPAAAAAR